MNSHSGQRWLRGRIAHVGPQHAAPFDQRVRLELDLLREARGFRLGRDLEALAGDVVLPAVVRAPQAAFLVAGEPQGDAAMRAELVQQPVAPVGVAKGDQPLGEQLHPDRRAVVLRQLLGEKRRNPVAAEQPAPRGPGASLGEQVVLFLPEHVPHSGCNGLTYERAGFSILAGSGCFTRRYHRDRRTSIGSRGVGHDAGWTVENTPVQR